jgi:hypothetical protein
MSRQKHETCPFCEAWFQLIDGKLPHHLDVFRRGTCPGADKTPAEAEKHLREEQL